MNYLKEFWDKILTNHPQDSSPSRLTPEQSRVVHNFNEMAEKRIAPGMSRREFLKTQAGMIAFFIAMNSVFGRFFDVGWAASDGTGKSLAGQFIFDVQVHYVHDNYPSAKPLLTLRKKAQDWNPRIKGEKEELQNILFRNFYNEVFQQSDTKMAVLTNAPFDDKSKWFLTNEQALGSRQTVNEMAGRRALLAHAVFTPGQPGWMDNLEAAITMKPDAWKGYTLGDPMGSSKYTWRLNDEKLVYPAFELMEKAGIRNVCIHKGLLPPWIFRMTMSREKMSYAGIEDIGPAARDWPNLNFIIYHSGIQKLLPGDDDVREFKKSGRINWVTDLAEIPGKYGVKNVYAELGAVFAASAIAHPELCAGVLGTLLKGFGSDHVCWGTDSIWYGSPQWQIEAMRRIEIPAEMQKQYGDQGLGPADGPVKTAIFGGNSARLYGISQG
jgi:uncharacterized protein